MAPRKRKAEEGETVTHVTTLEKRVTRSSTRGSNNNSNNDNSKLKITEKVEKTKKKKSKEVTFEKNESETEKEEVVTEEKIVGGEEAKKTVVIEHCKQCNSFKTRAIQVKNGLEKAVPGINVLINPEKPRRGCFEVREEGGEKFVTLLDMKRPFAPMKALDMEQVICDIVEKVK